MITNAVKWEQKQESTYHKIVATPINAIVVLLNPMSTTQG